MEKELRNEDRARIARGWRTSAMTQPAYAAVHGITDRTLRMWIARWAPPCPTGTEAVRAVCERAIQRLRALVDGLGQPSATPASALEPKNDAGAAGTAPDAAGKTVIAAGKPPR